MRKLIVALLLVSLPFAAATEDCHFNAPRSADIDAAGLKHFRANLGSTDLVIVSDAGLRRIEIRGTACASDAARLNDLQFSARRSGDDAVLDAANSAGYTNFSLSGSTYAYLKLQVRVPASLAVSVVTESGDLHASGLASLDFRSGAGDLTADHLAGALTLNVGSADVRAEQVGSVDMQGTGSGDIHVRGVRGDVHSARSGSGELDFSRVGGGVTIGNSGSGDITLNTIGRDVDVGSLASGDLTADGVGGNFSVRAIGSGDIRQSHVKGKVSVAKSSDDE